jgi:hypothetical protein
LVAISVSPLLKCWYDWLDSMNCVIVH